MEAVQDWRAYQHKVSTRSSGGTVMAAVTRVAASHSAVEQQNRIDVDGPPRAQVIRPAQQMLPSSTSNRQQAVEATQQQQRAQRGTYGGDANPQNDDATIGRSTAGQIVTTQRWTTPNPGFVKCNIDGEIFKELRSSGMGAVIRDEKGVFLLCSSSIVPGIKEPCVIETLAIRTSLLWLSNMGYTSVEFESDAKLVTSNFTINSTYFRNGDLLLSSLPSKVSQNTSLANFFYSTSIGQGSDKVYGKAICQADSTPQLCSDFLTDSIENLRTYCPNQKEGLSVSHFGIHYSNRPVNGVVLLEPTNAGYNVDDLNSENQVEFYEIWNSFMEKVAEKASMEELVKYATGEVNSTSNQTIYVLMQCFPDLALNSCRYCLRQAVNYYEAIKDGYEFRSGMCSVSPINK
ncbi:cysteine-rich receptor-like protein kinase 14 [Euphorbia lathyris]|uniref:cysteine-rich receptor-like protein kinase 14 n=1 Tax=Euphorbia lathyris TaxID=212925 RepID=UPI0033137781